MLLELGSPSFACPAGKGKELIVLYIRNFYTYVLVFWCQSTVILLCPVFQLSPFRLRKLAKELKSKPPIFRSPF